MDAPKIVQKKKYLSTMVDW